MSIIQMQLPDGDDVAVEGGDDDVVDEVSVDVDQRRRRQHALRVVGVDRHCLQRTNNTNLSVFAFLSMTQRLLMTAAD